MKRQLCVLLIGLTLSLTACAGGYYPAYGYRPGYGNGYGAPVYGNNGYARAYPGYGYQGQRNFNPGGGRGWGGNGWGEGHGQREYNNGWQGHGGGERHEHG
jgi:hypothetical protein